MLTSIKQYFANSIIARRIAKVGLAYILLELSLLVGGGVYLLFIK